MSHKVIKITECHVLTLHQVPFMLVSSIKYRILLKPKKLKLAQSCSLNYKTSSDCTMYSFIEACMGVNLYVIVFQDLFYNFLFYDFKALISIEIQNPPPHTPLISILWWQKENRFWNLTSLRIKSKFSFSEHTKWGSVFSSANGVNNFH